MGKTLRNVPEVFRDLEKMGCTIEACGSRITCSPPPTDTDEDWLVAVPRGGPVNKLGNATIVSEIVEILGEEGFTWEGKGEHYQDSIGSDFMSFRRETYNLIVTASDHFAERHRMATHICKELNLMDKDQRIMVFQAVLYGKKWRRA